MTSRRTCSVSAHDLPQSFVNALVYELPVGKGRKFGADMHPVANAIIGGWQLSSIIRFGSGLPLGFTSPNTLGNYGVQIQRPNVADLKTAAVDNPTPDRWFNTAAFTAPSTYSMGNAPAVDSQHSLRPDQPRGHRHPEELPDYGTIQGPVPRSATVWTKSCLPTSPSAWKTAAARKRSKLWAAGNCSSQF